MDLLNDVILCLCAAAGGGINAVAGGGTLLTFPALVAVLGMSQSVMANATSTVALFPGSVSAVGAYRAELSTYRGWVTWLAIPSLLGGVCGALLASRLPPSTFAAAVPWLILAAATLFTVQPQIARWTGIGQAHATPSAGARLGIVVFQFFVAVYGGYFGAGIGILMLAALAMMGLSDIHAMNGIKSVLATLINGTAAAVFILDGRVHWPIAIMMAVAGGVGGYAAARIARQLNRQHVRRAVIAIGFSLATYYFIRQAQS